MVNERWGVHGIACSIHWPWNTMRGPVCTDEMELLQDMLSIAVGRGSKWEMLIVGPAVCVCVCLSVCLCCAMLSRSVVSGFLRPHGLCTGSSAHGDSSGKNTGVGFHAVLQGIFPTLGSNWGLLHCRWILYHLSHQGIPRILEWVAYSFSRGSSQPRNWTRVSYIAGRFFTSWATREALCVCVCPCVCVCVCVCVWFKYREICLKGARR